MPFLIDNYKPNTGGGSNDFTNLIHNILEGGEKDRLNRNAQLKETKPVFCWPVFTGEDVPDSDPASLARTLIVPFEWAKGETNEPLTAAQRLSPHLSAVGGSWIAWLTNDAGQKAAREAAKIFEKTRAEWAQQLRANRKDMVNTLRVASNLATNQLTWWVMRQHPEIGPVVQEFTEDHSAGLGEIAEQMAGRTAESFEAVRFLSALRELLATGRCVLLPKDTPAKNLEPHPERMLGWRDGTDKSTYVMPTIAYQMVEKFLGPEGLSGVSAKTLYAQLASLGYIQSHATGRHTKTMRLGGGEPIPVLHLTPNALSAKSTGDEDADESDASE
jgi:hypothetical protein